jgi:hypothetical protein
MESCQPTKILADTNIYIYSGPGMCRRYGDSLRNVRSRDRIPVGARFYAPVQTYPAAHPAFYTMGTRSFPGVKRPVCGVDHLPPYSAEVKERADLYICSLSGPSWPVLRQTLLYTVCVCMHVCMYIYIYTRVSLAPCREQTFIRQTNP